MNIWMPHFGSKGHRWWIIRVILRELQLSFEITTFVKRVFRTLEHNVPQKEVVVIFKTYRGIEVVRLLNIYKLKIRNKYIVPLIVCSGSFKMLTNKYFGVERWLKSINSKSELCLTSELFGQKSLCVLFIRLLHYCYDRLFFQFILESNSSQI